MDSDQPPRSTRKVRFQPKPPPRTRSQTRAAPQREPEEADDATKAEQLRRHFNEKDAARRERTKVENKPPAQPVFINEPKQSTSIRAFNVPEDKGHRESNELGLKRSREDGKEHVDGPSFADKAASDTSSGDDSSSEAEYREPRVQDYVGNYLPIFHPWNPSSSGNPDNVKKPEPRKASTQSKGPDHNESSINPAKELDLLNLDEGSENAKLIFLTFPKSLPFIKRSASAKGKEKEGSSATPDQRSPLASCLGGKGSSTRAAPHRLGSLEDLPAGKMGKLLVYKNGAVKLKLGDALFDVSPGTKFADARDIVAINTKEKACCAIGELHNQANVIPDIDNILDSESDLV